MRKSTYRIISPRLCQSTVLQKRHKYNVSEKSERTHNGIVYDSKKEMERAVELETMEKAGQIRNLERQVPFVLLDKFTDYSGKVQRAITYVADFKYETEEGTVVEDVKSRMTQRLPEYRMKKKMFLSRYPQYIFFENVR